MKTNIIIFVVLFGSGIFNFSYSQDGKGKVYFFQCPASKPLNLGPGNSLFMDGKVLCHFRNKAFSIQEIDPGEHTFSFQEHGDVLTKEAEGRSITINVESGKVYYVELFRISIYLTADYFISEVPETTFKRVAKKYKQNKECK